MLNDTCYVAASSMNYFFLRICFKHAEYPEEVMGELDLFFSAFYRERETMRDSMFDICLEELVEGDYFEDISSALTELQEMLGRMDFAQDTSKSTFIYNFYKELLEKAKEEKEKEVLKTSDRQYVYVIQVLKAIRKPNYEIDAYCTVRKERDRAENCARLFIENAITEIYGVAKPELIQNVNLDYCEIVDDNNKIIVSINKKNIS